MDPSDEAAPTDADNHRRPACTRCGLTLTPIAYGYPDPELFEAAERGEVVLGGCLTFVGQPTTRCSRCEAEVGSATANERDPRG